MSGELTDAQNGSTATQTTNQLLDELNSYLDITWDDTHTNAKLSGILADNKIGIFAVSTFNTDYILVKKENFERAMNVLASAGYSIV